jgi:hypothetical protein
MHRRSLSAVFRLRRCRFLSNVFDWVSQQHSLRSCFKEGEEGCCRFCRVLLCVMQVSGFCVAELIDLLLLQDARGA